MSRFPAALRSDVLVIAVLLVLGLARGLLYASVQWPWYAPDEPDHVEFALLVRERGPLSADESRDPIIRRAIARSLYEWGVYDTPVGAGAETSQLWTGEVGRQPVLYYLLAAGVTASGAPLVGNLYAMRVLSALLGALLPVVAYLAGRRLAQGERLPALGLAMVLLSLPSLGALGGAVSNDILAALSGTLALTSAIHLVTATGVPRQRLGWTGATLAMAALALLSKRTAAPEAAIATLAVVWLGGAYLWRWLAARGMARLGWAAVAVALVGLAVAAVGPAEDRAEGWRVGNGARAARPEAVHGSNVLWLQASTTSAIAEQNVPDATVVAARGLPLSFGVWLRAADGQPSATGTVRIRQAVKGKPFVAGIPVTVGSDWQWVAVQTTVSPDASSVVLGVVADPNSLPLELDAAAGAIGRRGLPATAAPNIPGNVHWEGGEPLALDNASFEVARLGPRAWLAAVLERLLQRDPWVLLEPGALEGRLPTTGEAWQLRIWEPFYQSVFAKLGRQAELTMPDWWYATHLGLLALAGASCTAQVVRTLVRRSQPCTGWWPMLLLSGAALGSTLVAVGPYLIQLYEGHPVGRYFLPAALPLAVVYIWGLVRPWPARYQLVALLGLWSIFALLDWYVLFYALPSHFAIGGPRGG